MGSATVLLGGGDSEPADDGQKEGLTWWLGRLAANDPPLVESSDSERVAVLDFGEGFEIRL